MENLVSSKPHETRELQEPTKLYRDSATLKLAAEINDFVRSKTNDLTVADVALEAARVTFSLHPWPPSAPKSQ